LFHLAAGDETIRVEMSAVSTGGAGLVRLRIFPRKPH
jgi:hypothetical protein